METFIAQQIVKINLKNWLELSEGLKEDTIQTTKIHTYLIHIY